MTLVERHGSPECVIGRSARREYLITGAASFEAAVAEAEGAIASSFLGLTLDEIRVSVEFEADEKLYLAVATYTRAERQPPEQPTPGAPGESYEIQFDTTGGSRHITHSIKTSKKYPEGEGEDGAPDFQKAIGISPDGKIEGCDIVIPQLRWQERHFIAAAHVNDAYLSAIYQTTGKVNDATWRIFAAGEVLFLGASGRVTDRDRNWEITFSFAVEPNRNDIKIGDWTIEKKGHEYLWVLCREKMDEERNVMVMEPAAAYVEQVYETADFSVLGLG